MNYVLYNGWASKFNDGISVTKQLWRITDKIKSHWKKLPWPAPQKYLSIKGNLQAALPWINIHQGLWKRLSTSLRNGSPLWRVWAGVFPLQKQWVTGLRSKFFTNHKLQTTFITDDHNTREKSWSGLCLMWIQVTTCYFSLEAERQLCVNS